MHKFIATAALTLGLATLAASAQQDGEQPPPPPPGGGPGGRMERPSPEKIAAMLMEKGDTDKDGKLNAKELAAALAAGRPQRGPRGPHSPTNAPPHAEGKAGDQPQDGKRPAPPSPDVIAGKMIEQFASDKTALTKAELQKALEAHRPQRGGPGGQRGGPGGHRGGPQGGDPQGPPPQNAPADQ
jgi:translation initiation factor IF-2